MSASSDPDKARFFGHDVLDYSASSNESGWMVSYADMMTIIVTFLILLLSVSTIAQTKFDMLVEALTGRKIGNLHKVKKKIDEVVERASIGGEVTTNIDEDGLKVQFSNALLFQSGEAELTDKAQQVFTPIADHLVNDLEPSYGVTIEGYTDDVPIENGQFDSNWELSTGRAINVMKRLSRGGFDRRRMSVQGFADTRSATDVDLHDPQDVAGLSEAKLAELRAKNRRVVLRINRLDAEVVRDILGPKAERKMPPADGAGEQEGSEGGSEAGSPPKGGIFGSPEESGGGGAEKMGGAEESGEESSGEQSDTPSGLQMFDSNGNDAK